jgi:hypothetical protein
MGCFCRQSVEQLQEKLQHLDRSTPDAARAATGDTPTSQDARDVAAAAQSLAARALPDDPWRPDPAWRDAALPTPELPPQAAATLTSLATMREQSRSALGLDPLQPEQAKQLKRVVTTLNERLKQMANTAPPPDAAPWQRLADQSEAADSVQKAAKSGLLDPSPEQVAAYSQPAAAPMQQWLPLLRKVRALAPLLAAAKLLDAPLSDPQAVAQTMAEAVRKLRNLDLPPPAEPAQAARLMSALSAVQRLRQSLGVDPTEAGYAAVQKAVAEKTKAAAAILRQAQAQRTDPPPNLPYCPTRFAPPAVIEAAKSEGARALAAIAWKVPAANTLSALQSGLPASSLAKQIADALGASPVRSAPCGSGCDAARLMKAAA